MISGFAARLRSFWRGARRPAHADATEMREEFRAHMELRADDLVRGGMRRADAMRQARVEFGTVEQFVDEGRASRGLAHFDDLRVSLLDFKLGFRMLVRYPGLTIVGGVAIAFAIWAGATTFELTRQLLSTELPLPEGDRVVGIEVYDIESSSKEFRIAHEFTQWNRDLRSIKGLTAFRESRQYIVNDDGSSVPVVIADISPGGFAVARVAPLYGRALYASDTLPSASPVVVLGYAVWARQYAKDPSAVGRTVRIGATVASIVGVMPDGFTFPVAHEMWMPLRIEATAFGWREGPPIQILGRLADGITLEQAQAEVAAYAAHTSLDHPATHKHIRPRVQWYKHTVFHLFSPNEYLVKWVQIPVVLLLLLVCANVALLMFARAATREHELAVRNALGASRTRIVMQLFAEALVLGAVGAFVGLAAARAGLRWLMHIIEVAEGGVKLPFWLNDRLSPYTIGYAIALAVLGAALAGGLPGIKATRGLGQRIKNAATGGADVTFGGVWTAVIVAQVTLTVAFPVGSYLVWRDASRVSSADMGYPEREFLKVRLLLHRQDAYGRALDTSRDAFRARYRATFAELERRIAMNPSVAAVTFADLLPRMNHPAQLVELDAGGGATRNEHWPDGYRISSVSTGPRFFQTLGAELVAGRDFLSNEYVKDRSTLGDGASGGSVVVNQRFVKLVLGNRQPLGRRFRYLASEEQTPGSAPAAARPWHEIVGVIEDVGVMEVADPKGARVYHPADVADVYPAQMAIHVRGDPARFGSTLPSVAALVDPTLQLDGITPMGDVSSAEMSIFTLWFRILLAVSLVSLTLSLAAIYAVMSFAVTRRTREIGVRMALGANPRSIIFSAFRRPMAQVGLGIAAGAWVLIAMHSGQSGGIPMSQFLGIAAYALLMIGICLTACVVPVKRALRVQPSEALRAEG